MKVSNDMVFFDKSSLQKLQAQLVDVQSVYNGGVTHSTVQDALHRLQEKARDTQVGYRGIFQSAFKNLEDHIIDVQNSPGNKYRRGSVQRPRRLSSTRPLPRSELVVPLPTRSQLDPRYYPEDLRSSLQVFQIRKLRPLTATYKPLTSGICRPAGERPRTSPATHRPEPPQTPCPAPKKKYSQQESLWYPPWMTRPDVALKEDTALGESLGPDIFSYFAKDHRPLIPTLTYGGINKQTANKWTLTEESTEGTKVLSENLSSTSGIDSDGGISDIAVENSATDDLDTGSTSEVEKGNNPLADLLLQLSVLDLRPEKMEPSDTAEVQCFDFSVGNLEYPIYEFVSPVPFPLDTVDARLHAKEGSDWRVANCDRVTVDPVVGAMFDRLVEMERLQMETQEWEEKRLRFLRKRPVSRCNKLPDRRGCMCSRPGCFGGCSSKRNEASSCEKCHQLLGNGICRNCRCDLRIRQCGDERRTVITTSQLPPQQSCKSANKQTESGKPPSRTLFPRPKTSISGLSRGRSASESRQFRPLSASIPGYSSKEAERLGLEPPRSRAQSNNRLVVRCKTDEQITSKNSRGDVSTLRRGWSRTRQRTQRHTDQV